MQLVLTLLQLVLAVSSTFAALHYVKPMEGFQPEKGLLLFGELEIVKEELWCVTFLGKWWFVQATAKVFHRKEGCSHFVVTRKDGDTYNVVAQFTVDDNSQKTRHINLDFEDEPEHPAKFAVFLDGNQVVWATVLGTDYDHWAVIYIREGGFESFTVASRGPRLDGDFDSAVRTTLQGSQVTTDLGQTSGKSCPDDI